MVESDNIVIAVFFFLGQGVALKRNLVRSRSLFKALGDFRERDESGLVAVEFCAGYNPKKQWLETLKLPRWPPGGPGFARLEVRGEAGRQTGGASFHKNVARDGMERSDAKLLCTLSYSMFCFTEAKKREATFWLNIYWYIITLRVRQLSPWPKVHASALKAAPQPGKHWECFICFFFLFIIVAFASSCSSCPSEPVFFFCSRDLSGRRSGGWWGGVGKSCDSWGVAAHAWWYTLFLGVVKVRCVTSVTPALISCWAVEPCCFF